MMMFRFIFGVVLGVLALSAFVKCELSCYSCGPADAACHDLSISADTLQKPCNGNSTDGSQGFAKEVLEKSLETSVIVDLQEAPSNEMNDFDCYSVVYIGDKHTKGVYRGCVKVREGITACDIIKEEYGNYTDAKEGCSRCKENNCNSNVYSVQIDTHRSHNDDGGANNINFTFSLALFVCFLYYLL